MRTLRFTYAVLIALFSISFTACSSDADESDTPSGTSIVGTWTLDTDGEFRVYTFRSDGTGTESEPDYPTGLNTWDITYTYDAEAGTLLIISDNGDVTFFYNVTVTENLLILTNDNGYGGTVVFTRTEGSTGSPSQQSLLIGTWRFDYTWGGGYDLFIFREGGSGFMGEYPYGQEGDLWPLSYNYDEKKGTLTLFDGDGESETVHILSLTEDKMVLIYPGMYPTDEPVTFYRVK